jgi:peptidyl-prolyl cis-trans isomerase C
MKALSILLFTLVLGQAQTAPPQPAPALPDLPDPTVIGVFPDGYVMTMGEFKKIFAILPAQTQQNALKDRENFLNQWAIMRKLSQMAQEQKLDEQSPTHESLDYYRMQILTEAEMQNHLHHVIVPPEEARQYYEAHRDKYKEVHLKAIKLAFSEKPGDNPGDPGARNEEQAKALAAKVVADLRAGGDFVKAVAQYSDDATSKAKDGDFVTIHGTDNIPEQIRSAVMAMKAGDISDPIRQPNALYVFRAESVSYKGFEDVSNEIFEQLRMDHYRMWMDQNTHETKVDFKSPEFLGKSPAGGKPPSAH